MMWPVIRQIAKVGIGTEKAPLAQDLAHVGHIHENLLKILGRALTIREVDAGSCNGCELELNALGNLYYNLEGLGIKFVASPRHADMLLVTGPVSRNMSQALAATAEAMPAPKIVVAVGDCAINGGIFGESYASLGGVSKVLIVDLAIPGCPPEPVVILEGILTAVRYRLEKRSG
jgi:Ni,Fe-hydrogenase III small subunit